MRTFLRTFVRTFLRTFFRVMTAYSKTIIKVVQTIGSVHLRRLLEHMISILHWERMASQTMQNGWVPEIKKLNDNLKKLEESLTGTDECMLDIYRLEEMHGNKMDVLTGELTTIKADVADLKDHLASVIKELDVITNGGIEDELFGVKAENIEMRNHFNCMIKQLNQIASFVNQKHGYRIIEETSEFDHGTTPNSPKGYNLRSHVIDIE